jgi:hypothetical protein
MQNRPHIFNLVRQKSPQVDFQNIESVIDKINKKPTDKLITSISDTLTRPSNTELLKSKLKFDQKMIDGMSALLSEFG